MLAADVPTPEQVLVHREDKRTLHDLLAMLPTRTRLAVEHRFGLADGRKHSYREVGDRLGVTAAAARRLVRRAVDTVRQDAVAHT